VTYGRDPFYVASRASLPERSALWRGFRDRGCRITSSWIDAVHGETDVGELWMNVIEEIRRSKALMLYAEPGDFPLKGALVEVGGALLGGKRIVLCLPGVEIDSENYRPVGSWMGHPRVTREDDVEKAALLASGAMERRTGYGGL
jgi:hypothetical protein